MPASTRSPARCSVRCVVLLLLLAAPLPARAWQFVNVIDTDGPYREFTPPGINASGVIATRARRDDFVGEAIVAGDSSGTYVVADTDGPYNRFLVQVTISDLGTVFFGAEGEMPSGWFTGPNPDTDRIDGEAPAVDAADNVVALVGVGDDRGIFRGATPLVTAQGTFDLFARPALNDTGTVAFRVQFDDGDTGVYTVPLVGGPVTTVAETDGPFSGFKLNVAINDAGDVVFQAGLDALPGEFESGIFTGPNPATDTVVDTSGPFVLLGDPAITENGSVLFWGALAASAGGGGGIFSGPDPVADKVIRTFDPLFGSQVGNVNMRSEGYSNGRIAFSYALTDGREGVAIAFAPEPAGAAGAAAAACILLGAFRARRRTQ